MTYRDERHHDQVRRSTQARNAAHRRLVAAHSEEFAALYREECQSRDVQPRRTKEKTP